MCRLLVFSLAIIVYAIPAFAFEPLFDTWIEYPAGSCPKSICAGDFNGDGYCDVAISRYIADTIFLLDTISVYFGNGDGTLQPPVNYDGGYDPNDICAADLDADGDLDLIAANCNIYEPYGVAVLVNNGSGIFSGPERYCQGYDCGSVTVNDFDGDGDPDIASVGTYNFALLVMFNYGDGTFAEPYIYHPAGLGLGHITSADFDNDGDVDIAVASINNYVNVCTNDGHGGFHDEFITYQFNEDLTCLISTDFDSDGDADLVISGHDDDSLHILINDGNADFTLSNMYSGRDIENILPVDFDDDGDFDIFSVGGRWRPFSIHVNDGSAQFTEIIELDAQFNDVCAADFNGDGYLDIAGAMGLDTLEYGWVGIITNLGGGQIMAHSRHDNFYGLETTACDFNNDGETDLATVNSGINNQLIVFLNNGDGTFSDSSNYPVGDEAWDLAIGDFNGDSYQDIVTVNKRPNTISILHGNGDGSFQPYIPYAVGTFPYWVGTGDFDNDNDCDIAVVCPWFIDSAYNVLPDSLYILLNDNNTGFLPAVTYSPCDHPNGIVIVDIDANGTLDILVLIPGGEDQDSLVVMLNDGNAQFQRSACYPGGNIASAKFQAADLDNDGDYDIAVSCVDSIAVFLNNGDGALANPVNYFTFGSAERILAVDIDNDSDLDLIAEAHGITVLINDGHGIFESSTSYHGDVGAPVDVDHDDDLDLAIIRYDTVEVFTNRTDIISDVDEIENIAVVPATFTLNQNYPNPFNPATQIGFTISQRGRVTLAIYNILGQKVCTLVDQILPAGQHNIFWDGTDDDGYGMASGIYFYQLSVNGLRQSKKMILLK